MKKEKHLVDKIYGNHQLARYIDVYEVSTERCHSVPESGYKGTEATLVDDDPAWNEKFSSYSITGATLTGNNFILNNDVTAQAIYETAKNVTLQTDGHGTIASTKNSGFINDNATLSNTASNGYGFSGYSITGATLTGSNFKFTGSDITAKAWFSAAPHYTAKNVSNYLMSVNASAWADDDYRSVHVYENAHPDYSTIIPFNVTSTNKNFYAMPTNKVYTTFIGNSALFDGFKVQAMGGYNRLSGRYLNTTALITGLGVHVNSPWVYLNNTATGPVDVYLYASINNGTPQITDASMPISVSPGGTVFTNGCGWTFTFNSPIILNSGNRVNIKFFTNVTNGSISANLKQIEVSWRGTISGLEK